jgi:regulator of protease activity HflC (stomatin/prohibitin superfamily)
MEWISSLFYSLANFLPRLLNLTEDMVCIRMNGSKHKRLKPGYHIYTPLIHEIRTAYITRQELDLPEQILTTRDQQAVLVSASLVYRVVDPVKALIQTQNYSDTVIEVAQKSVKSMVTHSDLRDVIVENEDFDEELRSRIMSDIEEYGLEIDEAFLTSAVATNPYHVSGLYINMSS